MEGTSGGPALLTAAAPSRARSIGPVALVTGATGFIGSHLVEELCARGWRVKALVRPTSNCELLRRHDVTTCVGALADPRVLETALVSADVVFHLAGQTSTRAREAMLATNVTATAELAAACADLARPPIIVSCSSLAAAGPAPADHPRTRQHPSVPRSTYGCSKRAGEMALEKIAGDVPVTILRPGMVFGPRGKELLPIWQAIARARLHIVLGVLPPRLSLVWVGDLVRWMIQAASEGRRVAGPGRAERDAERGYYFAAAEESLNYTQLGWAIARSVGVNPLVIHFPEPFAYLVGGVAEVLGPLLGIPEHISLDKVREALAASWEVDSSATYRDLGGPPERPLRKRLAELTEWYRWAEWL